MTGRKRVRDREVADTAAAAKRFIRAAGRHVGHKDVDQLQLLVDLAAEVDAAMQAAVTQLHDVHGYSWGRIALALGTSRQAVQQRFGKTSTTDRQVPGQDVLL